MKVLNIYKIGVTTYQEVFSLQKFSIHEYDAIYITLFFDYRVFRIVFYKTQLILVLSYQSLRCR